MTNMTLAKAYNHITGANITHKDVEKWGIIETAVVNYALNMLMEQNK